MRPKHDLKSDLESSFKVQEGRGGENSGFEAVGEQGKVQRPLPQDKWRTKDGDKPSAFALMNPGTPEFFHEPVGTCGRGLRTLSAMVPGPRSGFCGGFGALPQLACAHQRALGLPSRPKRPPEFFYWSW